MPRPKNPPRFRESRGAYYYVAYTTIDGVRRQKWDRLHHDRGIALKLWAEREAQRSIGERDFRALWLAYQEQELPTKAAATRKAYRIWGNALAKVFGHMLPEQLEQRHAQELLDRARHKVTAQRMVQLLSTVLSFGARRGWLRSNHLLGMRKGPVSRRKRYITDDEWAALLAHAGPLAPMLRLAYLTALRREDLIGLRWADIREDGIHARVHKVKRDIVIPWTAELRQVVDDIRAARGKVVSLYLFGGVRGGKPDSHRIYMRYKAVARKAGCGDVTLHDIRRRRITKVTETHGEHVAQRLAVHSDVKTTRGYNAAPELVVPLPDERQPNGERLSPLTKSTA